MNVDITEKVDVRFYGNPDVINTIVDALKKVIHGADVLMLSEENSRLYCTKRGRTGFNRNLTIRLRCKMIRGSNNHQHYLTNQ
jgi:hypothetical protein